MVRSGGSGTQIKVKFAAHLYDRLRREASLAGVTMASLVKLAVAARYEAGSGREVSLQTAETVDLSEKAGSGS